MSEGRGTADASFWELRIHGVAGTSAESLLEVGVRETEYGLRPGLELTERGPRVPRSRRAFSWGSLTSGQPRHAFNILLLPFMLCNVAGWMLPSMRPGDAGGAPPRRARLATAVVRLHGLAVTVLWSTFVALAFVDVAPAVAAPIIGDHRAAWSGFALAVVVVAAVARLTTVTPRDPWRPLWPARSPLVVERARMTGFDVDPDRMWATAQTVAHCHRPHTAVAFSVIAATVCVAVSTEGGIGLTAWPPRITGGLAQQWVAVTGLVAAGVCVAASIGLLAAVSWSAGGTLSRSWSGIARRGTGLSAALGGVMAGASLSRLPVTPDATLPGLRGALVVTAVSALIAPLVVGLLETWGRRGRTTPASRLQAWSGPSLMLLAAAAGAVYGAGFLLGGMEILAGPLTGRAEAALADVVTPATLQWVALDFLVLALVLVVGVGVRLAGLVRRQAPDVGPRLMAAVRQLVDEPTHLVVGLGALGMTGFVALGATVGFGTAFGEPGSACTTRADTSWGFTLVELDDQTCLPIASPDVVWLLAGLLLIAAAVIAVIAVAGTWRWPLGLVLGVAGLALLLGAVEATLAAGWPDPLAWLESLAWQPPLRPSLAGVAVTVAFVAPFGAIVSKMVNGVRDRSTRRGLAVLWDLTTFWPRWFHPLAQRSYSDTAVSGLAEVLRRRGAVGAATVVAPHSQGSVIAVPACLLADAADPAAAPLARVALLTFGSPVRRLYGQMFPGMFHVDLLTTLTDRLTDPTGDVRWRNLWRVTDPIGGAVARPGDVDGALTEVDRLSDPPRGLLDPQRRLHSDYWMEPRYADALAELRGMLDVDAPEDGAAS